MTAEHGYVDISRMRVTPGKEERFVEVWANVVHECQEAAGGNTVLHAQLLRPVEGDVWADMWRWREKADADRLTAAGVVGPSRAEMDTITDLISVDWYEVAAKRDV